MSCRQVNITITKEQEEYVRTHPDETITSMAAKFGISAAKLSMSMKIMGMSKPTNKKKVNWENGEYFNEKEFAKLYSY